MLRTALTLVLLIATPAAAFEFTTEVDGTTTVKAVTPSGAGIVFGQPTNADGAGVLTNGCPGTVLITWDPDRNAATATPTLSVWECNADVAGVAEVGTDCYRANTIDPAVDADLESAAPVFVFAAVAVGAQPTLIQARCKE